MPSSLLAFSAWGFHQALPSAGGLIGGVINALVAPLFGELHILSLFGVTLTPELTKVRIGSCWQV